MLKSEFLATAFIDVSDITQTHTSTSRSLLKTIINTIFQKASKNWKVAQVNHWRLRLVATVFEINVFANMLCLC